MKKIVIVFLIGTLLISGGTLPVAGLITTARGYNILLFVLQGVKDQTQEKTDEIDWLHGGEWQEFVPVGKNHFKIEVHIGCYYGGSPPITLSIEKPLGTILASRTLPAAAIPLNSEGWVAFDNLNVALQHGQTYYIVLDFLPGAEYSWSGAWGNPYPNGVSSKDPDWDYAFRTFVDKSKPGMISLTPFTKTQYLFQEYFPFIETTLIKQSTKQFYSDN